MKIFNASQLLINEDLEHPGWVQKDFWITGSKGFVAGPPKSMKSMLVMDFAFSLATGSPFLGHPYYAKLLTILYIQQEMPLWMIRDRLAKMCDAKNMIHSPLKEAKNGIYSFDFSLILKKDLEHFYFTDPNECHKHFELLNLVKEIKPDLIVVDPLYTFTNSDLVKNSEVQPVLTWLDDLAKAGKPGKTSVMVIHHTAKTLDKKTLLTPQNLLGSTFLHGWAECLWMLTPTKDNQIMLVRQFRADRSPPNVLIDFNIASPGEWGYALKGHQN